jgi:hypothetical protein
MLKGDIDSGRTGDKNPVFDPGLSPLGTDDEAGGTPPTPERVELARTEETKRRWRLGLRITSHAHDKSDRGALFIFFGLILLTAVVLVGVLWLT